MLAFTSRRRLVNDVLGRVPALGALSADEMRARCRDLAWQARSGRSLRGLLPESFALAIEATRRALGMTHFPVQVQGAIAIFQGRIAEMQTGEGKTLTAVLPAALRALAGQGCHVLTANDYLAQRDAELLQPVYNFLGLTVGCIHPGLADDARRSAYLCDVTYGTASEMGFDFLRDRIKAGAETGDERRGTLFPVPGGEQPVQRGQYFALVDEADSILIDEARTPLIIGSESPNAAAMTALYQWCASIITELDPARDFIIETRRRTSHLTEEGCRRLTLLSKPAMLDSIDTERIYQHVEKALTARYIFVRDKDYILRDDEVAIVDEGTGRMMEGRKWQEGLHQSIEAKERVPITPVTSSTARITIQTLFRRYEHLGGMTGTAALARRELHKIYRLKVDVIPTNRPCVRQGLPARVFVSLDAKWRAVARDVQQLLASGRAVLIGTPSVEASEGLSAKLSELGIGHQILNARLHEREADIISQAGQSASVTIATNMAGRGTDILLRDEVRGAGGLHVIATELHTSARIDRQLVGRAARQGDPGSYQFLLSLEDELLRVAPATVREGWLATARPDESGEIAPGWERVFRRTQRQLERLHTRHRRRLLKYEREQLQRCHRMGLDPFLEIVEE